MSPSHTDKNVQYKRYIHRNCQGNIFPDFVVNLRLILTNAVFYINIYIYQYFVLM